MSHMNRDLNVAIVAINAQWVHTAAAARILRNVAQDAGFSQTRMFEFNSGDAVWRMAITIASFAPAVVGFSVYIWNRREMIALARRLRAVLPGTVFVAGGPEVTYESGPLPDFDVVLPGEGEDSWVEILEHVSQGWRPHGTTEVRPLTTSRRLVEVYRQEDMASLSGRLVYLETSRGCPFRCAFCLSGRADCRPRPWVAGTMSGLLESIHQLRAAGARTIKFLDRTFNAHPASTLEIFHQLAAIADVEFHFEICAELLDEATFAFLATVPRERFRFEIGVQSLNPHTLAAIHRPTATTKLLEAIERLSRLTAVHLHVDLIWGLPEEDFASIREGFNTLFAMVPDEVQLGFLKKLSGAPLESVAPQYGCRFDPEPPYEILCHNKLSGMEILRLKRFEQIFNTLWNSGRFPRTMGHLTSRPDTTPFDLFDSLGTAWEQRGLLLPAMGTERLCETLLDIFANDSLLKDLLRLDYALTSRNPTLPRCLAAGMDVPKHQRDALLKATKGSLVVCFDRKLDEATLTFSDEPGNKALFVVIREKNGVAKLLGERDFDARLRPHNSPN